MNQFPRCHRLLSPNQFRTVFRCSKRLKINDFYVHCKKNKQDHPRLGIAVAKREISHAYQRNRLKRLMRESFRQQQNLPNYDIILQAVKGVELQENQLVRAQLEHIWYKLREENYA